MAGTARLRRRIALAGALATPILTSALFAAEQPSLARSGEAPAAILQSLGVERPQEELLQFISREVTPRIRHGEELAARGAIYAARAKFIEALNVVALALDAEHREQRHGNAMKAGLRALDEADDFTQVGPLTSASLNLEVLVAKHQTPVLHGTDVSNLSPVHAAQQYYRYVREQLALCGEGVPAASAALCALGRTWSVSPNGTEADRTSGTAKAIALHQAALTIDPRNHSAANELGVLMVRCGRLQAAHDLFVRSLKVKETPACWYNISRVFEDLGDAENARRARARYAQLSGHAMQDDHVVPPPSPSQPSIQWVEQADFVRAGGAIQPDELPVNTKHQTIQPVANTQSPAHSTSQKPRVKFPAAISRWGAMKTGQSTTTQNSNSRKQPGKR